MASEQGLDLAWRSVGLYISMDGMYSADRAGHHELLMLVSKQMTPQNKLKSVFTQSFLWKRRRVAEPVQLLQRKDFINPTANIQRHDARNLSRPQELRQHFTGVNMWNQIIKDLWVDVPANRGDVCVYVDLCPYDDTFAGAIINQKSENSSIGTALPQAACISIAWVQLDSPTDKMKIAKFLKQSIRTTIYRDTMDKKYKLPALADDIFNPPKIETVPTVVLSDYTVCRPQDDGTLPILQTCHDEWSAIPGLEVEFKDLVDSHNAKFNPSGVPWKGQKRPTPDVQEEEDDKLAQPVSAKEGDPTTKEDADKAYGSPLTVPAHPGGVELLFYQDHGLFLHSNADACVTTQQPLGLLKGEFKLGNEAAQVETSGLACGSS
jgi:hypothetical protein